MERTNFKNETLFLSFTAMITSGNGRNGTNFHIRNRMVNTIEMSRDGLIDIVVSNGTQMFGKPVGKTSASFTDVKLTTFTARDAVNDVG